MQNRDSGSSHLLELSRQRLLLERAGDVEKYISLPLLPFPSVGEVHSQRKRSKTPPPGGPLPGPVLLYRKAKQLLMRHSGTSNSRRVLMLRDRLSLLVRQQQELLADSSQSSLELLRKLWDINADGPHTLQKQQQQLQQQHRYEMENSLLQERRTRPLGSRFLFICGIDLRMTGTDLENIFQTITEHPVYARLKRSKEGRHLGFGLMEFGSTLDATRCLLQLNGIKIGNSIIRLGEALGRAKEPQHSFGCGQLQQQPEQQQIERHKGGSRTTKQHKGATYTHPYPLPCE
ncbi:RNA recognition motif-containing protein, putative [Eimeria praecox]|uniref:RNA recognition motif-containing protein, putative n=1 Tax=Eimeria praecox TaxID=51316 RepID=U6H1X7_9EIME|nr:RNA recognition motif-containing protein, putative [Eimeria praecox]